MPAGVVLVVMCAALAVSEAVQLEALKTIAITISAAGAVASAYFSFRGRQELRRRRHEVRDPDTERVVVVDHPPTEPSGALRRATDPPPQEVH